MWLPSCEAAMLRRKRKATARQRMLVLPRMGLMPMRRPTAMLQASFSGDAPMRSSAKNGKGDAAIEPVVMERERVGCGSAEIGFVRAALLTG